MRNRNKTRRPNGRRRNTLIAPSACQGHQTRGAAATFANSNSKDALVDSAVSLAVLVYVMLAEGHADAARSKGLHQAVLPPVLIEHPPRDGLLIFRRVISPPMACRGVLTQERREGLEGRLPGAALSPEGCANAGRRTPDGPYGPGYTRTHAPSWRGT